MGFKTNTIGGGSGTTATVKNSDNSYNTTVLAGNTLVLPDTTFTINVNGVLNQTVTVPSIEANTINITAS